MSRENFLFYLGIIFITGNLTTSIALKLIPSDLTILILPINVIFLTAVLSLNIVLHRRKKVATTIQILYILTFFLLGSLFLCINERLKIRISDSILIENTKQKITGSIIEIGKTKKGLPKLKVNLGKENTILYILRSNTQIKAEIGDSIIGIITPQKITNFTNAFDYISYMADQSIFYTSFIEQKDIIITPCTKASVMHQIERRRQQFDKYLISIIKSAEDQNKDAYSIIKALTIGDKSNIGSDLKESFQKSGTMHLLALSGLHVGIIYKLLTYLFSILGNFPRVKKTRSIIIILILCIYAIITGFSTSILRAVIMATTYEISTLLGRDKNKLNTLAISAIIITILNPNAPSELGFQLSFSAMLGIFTFYPTLGKILPRKLKTIKPLWDTVCISLACQILTSPLIYYHFHTFSYFSLLINLFALPLTSVIMTILPIVLIFPNIPYLEPTLTFIVNLLIEIISLGKDVSDW